MSLFIDTGPFLKMVFGHPEGRMISDYIKKTKEELHTNTLVLNELKFKMLFNEAVYELGTDKKFKVIKYVKTNKKLQRRVYEAYLFLLSKIEAKMKIHNINYLDESVAVGLSVHYGLLPTDSSIMATMVKNNIKKIFTYLMEIIIYIK